MDLQQLNAASTDQFVSALGGMVEHSPWVALAVSPLRPFGSVWSLHQAMSDSLRQADEALQIETIRQHPELAGREAMEGSLTDHSNSEQNRLGLHALEGASLARLMRLNAQYRTKFGFPFIAALRKHRNLDSVFESMEKRLTHREPLERLNNISEIIEVLRGRLARAFGTPMGWLTTQVLDSVRGLPASAVRYQVYILEGQAWRLVAAGLTNDQGHTDTPLLMDHDMSRAQVELRFDLGRYFRAHEPSLPERTFLDWVPIRFGIDDPDQHLHVPLICTPWSYSTYRGG